MDLTKLTKEEIMELDSKLHYKRTKLNRIVDRFADSDEEVMQVTFDVGEYSTPSSCTSSIKNYLKKTGRDMWIDVKTLDGKCYIFKTDDKPIVDEIRNCVDCGEEFRLEAHTIQWCKDKGITPFIRCECCRKKRRGMKGEQR